MYPIGAGQIVLCHRVYNISPIGEQVINSASDKLNSIKLWAIVASPFRGNLFQGTKTNFEKRHQSSRVFNFHSSEFDDWLLVGPLNLVFFDRVVLMLVLVQVLVGVVVALVLV